jgi:carbonic anhydrase/acetyltransferase-like protein (isoleucine patch superfamily)
MTDALVLAFGDAAPVVDPSAWLAPTATLVGDVTVGPRSSIWYSAVLRADQDAITLGARSNVQDGSVLHTDPGFVLRVGDGVSVGHRAVLHGCTVEDDVLVGMGAVVMNGAVIGAGSLVAAGTVVLAGTQVPAGSLVAGLPGKVRRALTDDERAAVRRNADHYVGLAARHAER